MINSWLPERFKLLTIFSLIILSLSFIVRITLYILSVNYIDFSIINLFKIFTIGLFFDIGNLLYIISLYAIYLLLFPTKFHGSTADKIITKFCYGLFLFVFIFSFLAEIPFWLEYQRRYNFIAVDYLLYTYEVVENIHQSFPLPILIGLIVLILFLLIRFTSKKGAYKITFTNNDTFFKKLPITMLIVGSLFVYHTYIPSTKAEVFSNVNENELAKSGMYSFFAAYHSNELNYDEFYNTISKKEAYTILKKNIKASNDSIFSGNESIKRHTKNLDDEKKPNVIFIGLESLNARFMEFFGNKKQWTPTLDSLVNQSIFFTNIYATGTRTIRGLEAISLSVPPTPGRSIVKRENSNNLYTIGEVFKQKGYSRTFFYGGDGHFDNMTNYFGNNGFDIVDRKKPHRIQEDIPTKRTRIEDNEMTFENAWAISDQDLFKKVLKVTDEQAKENKPFFNFIMTSTNHKPYTYPDGVVDVPSGKNISGSVKYLDFSIKEFLIEAQKRTWFNNTVFVIMSDHCAFSAGRTEINVKNHHIPALIFNLKNTPSKHVTKLCSQIDIFPTLFGYLNWSYETTFYGKDISKMQKNEERALIGNHRKVGLLKPKRLLLLETQKKNTFYHWEKTENKLTKIPTDSTFLKETISYYQSAYEMFKNGKLKLN